MGRRGLPQRLGDRAARQARSADVRPDSQRLLGSFLRDSRLGYLHCRPHLGYVGCLKRTSHSSATNWVVSAYPNTNFERGGLPRDIGIQMMLAEWLFVETTADVRQRSSGPSTRSRYELIGIAPLLRKLLLDGTSLVDTVRRVRPEVPVEFRIMPWNAPAADDHAETLPVRRILRLGGPELVGGPDDRALTSVREFVSSRVGQVDGLELTVRDVVRYYAHIEGGVHFGEPKDLVQATLSSVAPLLLGHTTGQIEILAHIGLVVVDALTPLCNSILMSPTIDRRMHRINEAGFYGNHWTADHFGQP
jgi:hypothetical protein